MATRTREALQRAQRPVTGDDLFQGLLSEALARDAFTNLLVLLGYAKEGCWTFALYNHAVIREQVVQGLTALLDPVPVYEWTYSPHEPFPSVLS